MANLPHSLDTNEEWDAWEAHLLEVPQEELVEFLLARMAADVHTFALAEGQFGASEKDETDETIAGYRREAEREIMSGKPETEFLVSLSERMFLAADQVKSLLEKVECYGAVALCMQDAYERGVGMETDDDFLLIDSIRDAGKLMNRSIGAMAGGLSAREYEQIVSYLNKAELELNALLGEGFEPANVFAEARERLKKTL